MSSQGVSFLGCEGLHSWKQVSTVTTIEPMRRNRAVDRAWRSL